MPKQRAHRESAKCVKRTGKDGLEHGRTFTSHRFRGKTEKQHRQLCKASAAAKGGYEHIRQQLARMK